MSSSGFVRGSFPGKQSSTIFEDERVQRQSRVVGLGLELDKGVAWRQYRVQMTVPLGAAVFVVRLGRLISLA